MNQEPEIENKSSLIVSWVGTLSDVVLSWVFWGAFLIFGMVSFTIYNFVQNEKYMKLEAEFNEKVEESHASLNLYMSGSKDLLYAARSIYTALSPGDKKRWIDLMQSLPVHSKSSGQAGYALIQPPPSNTVQSSRSQHTNLNHSDNARDRCTTPGFRRNFSPQVQYALNLGSRMPYLVANALI